MFKYGYASLLAEIAVRYYNSFAFVNNFVGFINIEINDGLGWSPRVFL